jgi:hypothetical protein
VNSERETVRKILTEDFVMRNVCAKIAPKELTENQNTAPSVKKFLSTKQITVLEHPDYLPDLAPCDFFLFLTIKETSKGRNFYDIRTNTTADLKAIPQNQFQNYYEVWTRRWHQCMASQGEKFEGDHCVFCNEVCSTLNAMSSRTLLSDHVHSCSNYLINIRTNTIRINET